MAADRNDWTSDEIKRWLRNSNKFLARAIVAIYKLQTDDEKRAKVTKYHNNVGFNAMDADFLSDLAEDAIEAKNRAGKYLLTTAQLNAAEEPMLKYHRQLREIANGEIDVTLS